MRIMETGDLHLGRSYGKYEPRLAERYAEARFAALEKILRLSEEKECDLLVITGDLFDSHSVARELMKKTCALLNQAACLVAVLPGNHDYCTDAQDPFWQAFKKECGSQILLLNEERPYPVTAAGRQVVFYPAVCASRHSEENRLAWLRQETFDPACLNIGVAHGALAGISADLENRYYRMSLQELEAIPVDLWLIGHTHIPWPDLPFDQPQRLKSRIFNAGTHQQTDHADSSPGSVFLLDVDDQKQITAEKLAVSVLHFVSRSLTLKPDVSLASALADGLQDLKPAETSLRLSLSGSVSGEDYQNRENLYDSLRSSYVSVEIDDAALHRQIDAAQIDQETLPGSLENRLLKGYLDDPDLLSLAYDLVQACREGK